MNLKTAVDPGNATPFILAKAGTAWQTLKIAPV